MTQLNVEQICSITRHDKLENTDYAYQKPSIKMWYDRSPNKSGFIILPKFYSSNEILSEEDVIKLCDNNVYIENNRVFYKPRLSFRMSSQQYLVKYFETVEDLEVFLKQEILSRIQVINI